jgi:leucyl aminopeptidase (aminopeptidase T)
MRAAVLNFRKMGLAPVARETDGIRGANSVPVNEQHDYDHKADAAAYLDKAYVERYLECLKTSLEHHKHEAAVYAGPAVVEVFGKEAFTPQNKKENYRFDEGQQKLNVSLANRRGEITNQYIKEEERSFTIIAYPIPEIGEKFEEIFEKTVELNNLDYALYLDMQQKIIDLLDQGDFVHILGKGNNRTDLAVALFPLKNPKKETAFENCVADVNIPVGEVFTSPQLKGTNGTLHVTEVFLHQMKYVDLELKFQDGMIVEYSCKNFKDEKENQDFIKENLLHHHDTLPLGEFAIGTNTLAYKMGRDYGISEKLPILIAEKTGPHFAVGDTCYSRAEDIPAFNPDGKEIVARDNECSLLRKTELEKAYFNCHTDITIPYDELDKITVIRKDGSQADVISDGKFVVAGTESLNAPLEAKEWRKSSGL